MRVSRCAVFMLFAAMFMVACGSNNPAGPDYNVQPAGKLVTSGPVAGVKDDGSVRPTPGTLVSAPTTDSTSVDTINVADSTVTIAPDTSGADTSAVAEIVESWFAFKTETPEGPASIDGAGRVRLRVEGQFALHVSRNTALTLSAQVADGSGKTTNLGLSQKDDTSDTLWFWGGIRLLGENKTGAPRLVTVVATVTAEDTVLVDSVQYTQPVYIPPIVDQVATDTVVDDTGINLADLYIQLGEDEKLEVIYGGSSASFVPLHESAITSIAVIHVIEDTMSVDITMDTDSGAAYRRFVLRFAHGGDEIVLESNQISSDNESLGVRFLFTYTGSTIQNALSGIGVNNPPGYLEVYGIRSTVDTIDLPNIGGSALTVDKNWALADATPSTPSGVVGQAGVRIGSAVITAGPGESSEIYEISITDELDGFPGLSLADLGQNLRVVSGGPADANGNYAAGTQIGATVGTLTDAPDEKYSFHPSPDIRLNPGQQIIVELYLDVLSSPSDDVLDAVNSDENGIIGSVMVSATGLVTGSSTSGTYVGGLQRVYVAQQGQLNVMPVPSSVQPAMRIVDASTYKEEVFKFRVAPSSESVGVVRFIVTHMILLPSGSNNVAAAHSTLFNYELWSGNMQVGSTIMVTTLSENGDEVTEYVSFNLGTAGAFRLLGGQQTDFTLKCRVNDWPDALSGSMHRFALLVDPLGDGTPAVTAYGMQSSALLSGPNQEILGNWFVLSVVSEESLTDPDLNPTRTEFISYPGNPTVYIRWRNPDVKSLESYWIYRSEVEGERGELVSPPEQGNWRGSRDANQFAYYHDTAAQRGVRYFYTILLRNVSGTYSADTTQYEVVSGPGWAVPIAIAGFCDDGDHALECSRFIGQAPGSTDDYDGQDVEFESLPPAPPSEVPDMAFHMWNFTLDRPERTVFDIRSDEERNMEFALHFNAGYLGVPVQFTWDTSQLPANMSGEVAFIIRNESGVEVIHQTYADIWDGEVSLSEDSYAMRAGTVMFVVHRK